MIDLLQISQELITIFFFLVVLSYYVLIIVPKPKYKKTKQIDSVSILVPARNEERYIKACINSLLAAKWPGKKEIIVINDASIDKTKNILKTFGKKITVITNKKHTGKSASLNKALAIAKGDAITIVDGDSEILPDALLKLKQEIESEKVAAASSFIRVKNRFNVFCSWLHLEVIYASLTRVLFSKIGANVVTPGALSMYRKTELQAVGNFNTEGYAEDADVAIRLIRAGYRVHMIPDAISDTNMPHDIKGFFRQRSRIAKGVIKLLKTHLKVNNTIIDVYTLPLMIFSYIQAVIMGSITVYKISSGYVQYFASKGVFFSIDVATFFIDWFSVMGFIKWSYRILSGIEPVSVLAIVGILSTLLTYPLFAYAILRYDRKVDLGHVLSFFFLPVYWLINMVVQIVSLPEIFIKKQRNIWKKNEA